MVLINKAINEITCKLVYYGPGLCGKTTNLEKIYDNPKMSNKGKMISMSTETDRTLFFDFMPMELGSIGGQKIRVQLYTVPGQVFYDATRKLVLRGTDGVVFVADSQSSMKESNIQSLDNLKTNLRLNRLDPEKVPIVYQLNKRDLPNCAPPEEMKEYLESGDSPAIEASAIVGQGVSETLRAAVSMMLENIKKNVDVTLYEAADLKKPDLSVKSGVTHSSAGTPKVGVGDSEVSVSKPPVASPAPAPAPVEPEASPFGNIDEDGGPEPAEAAPFEAPSAPDESPFAAGGEALAEAVDDEENPFADDEAPSSGPVAVPDVDAGLEASLESARELVRQLESALESARKHEQDLAKKLGE